MTAHDLYLTHRDHIERALTFVCRRHLLPPADADDFCSSFRLHLMEDDYRIIRAFEGRCAPQTFFVTVIGRYYQDWRNKRWGKWRNSAEAGRLGPIAERLETLLVRDRLTMDEAVEMLRSRHGVTETRAALDALAARLPVRVGRTMTSDEPLERLPAISGQADALVHERDALRTAARASSALTDAMDALAPQDRLILRMHCADGVSLAAIARMLHLDQKPLYRRVDRLKDALREAIGGKGLSAGEVAEVLASRGLLALSDAGPGNFSGSVRPKDDSGRSPGARERVG